MVVHGAGPWDTCRPVRDRIRAFVDNMLAHSSSAMDAAAVKVDEDWWWTAETEELLASIGKGGCRSVQCHNCGGKGNFARDCPSWKGKCRGKNGGVGSGG
jgi:hypothetical protein